MLQKVSKEIIETEQKIILALVPHFKGCCKVKNFCSVTLLPWVRAFGFTRATIFLSVCVRVSSTSILECPSRVLQCQLYVEIVCFLRLLAHVKVSVRCSLKDGQFNLLVWLLLSLLSLFSYAKAINFHALAINI